MLPCAIYYTYVVFFVYNFMYVFYKGILSLCSFISFTSTKDIDKEANVVKFSEFRFKIFSKDRKFYDRKTLAEHRRVGDKDDRYLDFTLIIYILTLCSLHFVARKMPSGELYGFVVRSHKGHPLCQFCDERYLDNDELLKHLRKQHYFCHFCEADGIANEYYE